MLTLQKSKAIDVHTFNCDLNVKILFRRCMRVQFQAQKQVIFLIS